MPSWPSTVTPSETKPLPPIDPVISQMYDQGYKHTRSRYGNPKRRFEVIYRGLTRTQLLEMYVFVRDTLRGQANNFDWTFPHGETISTSSGSSPITITTSNAHGFKTNDTVIIAGHSDGDANGTWVISVVTATTFTLNGSTGPGTGTGGTATRKFLKMELDGDENSLYQMEKLIGAFKNNVSWHNMTFTFIERF